ncbi:MAG: pyrimidine/purine nucleoside phosphorylase [Gammaproteobacteria bacterium]|nr:pyrimidine/purine nucleoside phosphorylase [Gammaproteobacteria bacterium]
MFDTNEYFDGKVKSIAFSVGAEAATIGVMAAGEYEFGTSQQETMQVISGGLTIKLPGDNEWRRFGPGEQFVVEADQKFGVRVEEDSSYLCIYR